jgi:hypothetical protein
MNNKYKCKYCKYCKCVYTENYYNNEPRIMVSQSEIEAMKGNYSKAVYESLKESGLLNHRSANRGRLKRLPRIN